MLARIELSLSDCNLFRPRTARLAETWRTDMLTGYKTAIFSLLLVVFGAIQGFDWATIISDPQVAGWVATAIGVIVFALRAITKSPMFSDKP